MLTGGETVPTTGVLLVGSGTATGRLLADRAAEALVPHRMPGGPVHSWEEQSAQGLPTDPVCGVVPARRPRGRDQPQTTGSFPTTRGSLNQ